MKINLLLLSRIIIVLLLGLTSIPLLVIHTNFASEKVWQPLLHRKDTKVNHKRLATGRNVTTASRTGSTIHKTSREKIDDDGVDMKVTNTTSMTTTNWSNGCFIPTRAMKRDEVQPMPPPTGLVVVLAMAPTDPMVRKDALQRICSTVPNQLDYFVGPQGLDFLFIVQEDDHFGWIRKTFRECFNLHRKQNSSSVYNNHDGNEDDDDQQWINLDRTTLRTSSYYREGPFEATTTIFLASSTMQYPKYIQKDPSILARPIIPRGCEAPKTYIQATRWYTRELLNLGILKEYDYFLKIDTDIVFLRSIPFHMLEDMRRKSAIFGHTAEYHPKGSKTCAQGIGLAVKSFMDQSSINMTSPWKGSLCTVSPETQRDADQYYTNFIIGDVSFWQSPFILEWSEFLNEYPTGFFKYRWTDQIFWHYAMGLFLDNFHRYVVDYTTLRCMPHPSCWYSSYNFQRYGPTAWHRCDNDGYFLHPKDFNVHEKVLSSPTRHLVWNASQSVFESHYQKDCSVKVD